MTIKMAVALRCSNPIGTADEMIRTTIADAVCDGEIFITISFSVEGKQPSQRVIYQFIRLRLMGRMALNGTYLFNRVCLVNDML